MVLHSKTVLVSGVGPGLGGACVAAALRDGANVVATARDLPRLEGTIAELRCLVSQLLKCRGSVVASDLLVTEP